MQEGVKIGARL